MGADARIKMSRLTDGYHAVNLRQDPVFTVRKPVVVLCASFVPFGPRYSNLGIFEEDRLTTMLALGDPEVADCAVIRADGRVACGIVVADRERLFSAGGVQERWQKGFVPGSSLTLSRALSLWDKITPGVWAVTEYNTSGLGPDDVYFTFRSKTCIFTETVKWTIWT